MNLSFSTKDLTIGNKFSIPSIFYTIGLFVIGLSVVFFYTSLSDRHERITGLTEQKNSLSKLEASLAVINEDLVKVLYLRNQARDVFVLTRIEDLQSILAGFRQLSDKHGLISDQSLADEMEPIVDDLRLHAIRIIGLTLNKRPIEARKLYESRYLREAKQIMNFSYYTSDGKSEEVDDLYLKIEQQKHQFVIIVLVEFFVTFLSIYFLHRKMAQQLVNPVNQLHAVTHVLVKHFSSDQAEYENHDYNRFKVASTALGTIDSRDEIGSLANNFKIMISAAEKGISDVRKSNKKLIETQEQLVHSAKLASIGRISAGLAHELNQPLGAIKLSAQITKKFINDSDFDRNKVIAKQDKIIKQVNRSTKIINHLKTFSRQGTSEYESVDINWLIDEALILPGESLRKSGIQVITELAGSLAQVSCDLVQIGQVLTNLVTNAQDALEDAEEKCITIRSYERNRLICVDVEDTGCGMTSSAAKQVFDPFYTTKPVGKGTGLGMSISYGIIKDHNGEMSIASSEGHGSRFTFSLPTIA